jgi:hypothetical protein
MIAYCGLACDGCPIYLASSESDKFRKQTLRESIAKQCTELYGIDLKLEDITDCDGCQAETGRLFSGCLNCEIRKCALRRNIENCAFCSDYSCEKLQEHFLHDSFSQTRLGEIRHRLYFT